MLARGGVGPFAGGALAALGPAQADEQAAARRVCDIADQPVAALSAAVGEVAAAHSLGLACEPSRNTRDVPGHRFLQRKRPAGEASPS